MQRSGARILALLGLLAVPVLLAVGSQAIAERPGPPDVTSISSGVVHGEAVSRSLDGLAAEGSGHGDD